MDALIVVEADEWAIEVESILEPLGYKPIRSASASGTIDILRTQSIDLIICETVVNEEDSIALFQTLPDLQCSIIFITDSPSEETYLRTTRFNRGRFLVKPFHPLTLRSMVDSLTITVPSTTKGIKVRSSIGQRQLLTFDKILWISSDKNYSILHTSRTQYVLKQSLTNLSKQLDRRFSQVHKGFWVNLDWVTQVHLSNRQLSINESIIPIGKTYKDQFASRWLDHKKPLVV